MKQWAAAMFAQATLTVNYKTSQVTVADDWGVDRYTGVLTVTPKAGGPATTEEFKGVHIMRREGGAWKIAVDLWNTNAPPPSAPPPPPPPAGAAKP